MAAQVGDETVPAARRLKALDTLEKLQAKYSEINAPGAKAFAKPAGSDIDSLVNKYRSK
jgi:hypothetical protein